MKQMSAYDSTKPFPYRHVKLLLLDASAKWDF